MKDTFRVNNFDLIRLMAALQVALHHTLAHLKIEHRGFCWEILLLFPGVPTFFFVSGFLINKSYENNSVLSEYSRNRILRIYPALIACTAVAIMSVVLTGYYTHIGGQPFKVLLLIAGQISIFQNYHSDFMRGFGTGVLNGSLWTITVELQFYVLVPILYWVLGTAKISRRGQTIILVSLIFLFMAINTAFRRFGERYPDSFPYKLWMVSFTPWFYMFLVGILFQKHFARVYRVLHGRALLVLAIYVPAAYCARRHLGWPVGNTINAISYMLLAALVFACAYSWPALGNILLKKNDISYGVYIYHIPVINVLIYYGYTANTLFLILALVVTVLMASASWLFVERPAIQFKKHPLNPLRETINGIPADTAAPRR